MTTSSLPLGSREIDTLCQGGVARVVHRACTPSHILFPSITPRLSAPEMVSVETDTIIDEMHNIPSGALVPAEGCTNLCATRASIELFTSEHERYSPNIGVLTLTMPASDPLGPIHFPRFLTSFDHKLLDRPCVTLLLNSIAKCLLVPESINFLFGCRGARARVRDHDGW